MKPRRAMSAPVGALRPVREEASSWVRMEWPFILVGLCPLVSLLPGFRFRRIDQGIGFHVGFQGQLALPAAELHQVAAESTAFTTSHIAISLFTLLRLNDSPASRPVFGASLIGLLLVAFLPSLLSFLAHFLGHCEISLGNKKGPPLVSLGGTLGKMSSRPVVTGILLEWTISWILEYLSSYIFWNVHYSSDGSIGIGWRSLNAT